MCSSAFAQGPPVSCIRPSDGLSPACGVKEGVCVGIVGNIRFHFTQTSLDNNAHEPTFKLDGNAFHYSAQFKMHQAFAL
jgi:hypothetical protein